MSANYTYLASICPEVGDWFWRAAENAFVISYYVVGPIAFVFGSVGHCFLAVTLFGQLKQDRGYIYQIFVVISQIFESVFNLFYILGVSFYGLTGAVRPGPLYDWYTSIYGFVWYRAHLAAPLANAFYTICLLLTLSITVDRLFALAAPIRYRSINHRRHQVSALVSCLFIGLSTSVFDCFRNRVVVSPNYDDRYIVTVNEQTVNSDWVNVLNQFRNFVRTASLFGLITCNVAMIYFYRRYSQKTAALVKNKSDQQKAKQKENLQSLVRLSIYQSVMFSISCSFLVSYYFSYYSLPWLRKCGTFLAVPILDISHTIHFIDFYVLMLISKTFRQMAFNAMPIFKRFFKSANNVVMVAPVNNTGTTNRDRV